MFLFDSHCDTPSQLLRLRDLSVDNRYGHVDIPKMKKGDVGASFFALFSPVSLSEEQADAHALAMIAAVKEAILANSGSIASATSCEDILQNHSKGLISILLGMENGSPIGKSLERLEYYFDQGVRYLTLTHNADNAIADSAAGNRTWGGLSPFGKEVVATMDRLGMMIDLSHSSDETFWDVVGLSERPPMASHSCCRALCGHRRNLTDDMLRALGERDGYIGINFYPAFLYADVSRTDATIDGIAAQLRHRIRVGGLECAAVGTDFDGIDGDLEIPDASRMPHLFEELAKRGFTADELEHIAFRNAARVLKDIL